MGVGRFGSLLTILAGVALACDDETGPSAEELAGTWQATEVEYVSVSQPVQSVDVIAAGGSATLVLANAGTFTWTITPVGEPAQVRSGDWEAGGDVLTLTETGVPFMSEFQFNVVLTGNTLTLSGADSEYDFDGDSQEEPAKLSMVLER